MARAIEAVDRTIAQGPPSFGVETPVVASPSGSGVDQAQPHPAHSSSGAPVIPTLKYPAGVVYSAAPRARPDRDVLLNPAARYALEREIVRVVTIEQLIHTDLLLERLKELHRVARAGGNVQANFKAALRETVREKKIVIDGRGFVSVPGALVETFRCPPPGEEPRAIEHIAQREIELAALHVVESQFGLPHDALVRAVAQALGYERTRADVADRIREAVDRLIEGGELRRSGLQIQLA